MDEYLKTKHFARLLKDLYGLKQASRAFFETTRDALLALEFIQDLADCCVFRRENLLVGLYVDDLIVCGEDDQVTNFQTELISKTNMEIRVDNTLDEFVGMTLPGFHR